MNENLQSQYNVLIQSTTNLSIATREFLKKVKDSADTFSDHFLSSKSRQELAIIENNDHEVLMIYKDSIVQRFLRCYTATFNFLSLYLDENYLVKTQDPQKIMSYCLEYKIINQLEFIKFNQISKDFDSITQDPDSDISEEIIQYCLLMCTFIRKFKN